MCDLTDPAERDRWLPKIGVGKVWGIGAASERKLLELGIETVADLRDMPARLARQRMTIVGEKTVLELRGIACMALEELPPQRKGCAVTRSFSKPVTTLDGMLEALSAYATRAGEKLRRHGLETSHLVVFIHTSPFNQRDPAHGGSKTVHLPESSADTLDLIEAAKRGARAIFKDGYAYAKAGIILDDLIAAGSGPRPLFDARDRCKSDRLMGALDAINGKFGRGALVPAAAGTNKREWETKFDRRSPRYTTRLDDLPRARC